MADVFLSYASEDRERAHTIADALTARGWSVWWDRQILPGETFESVIERELASADCVLVLWSQHSVQSHWTKAEADEALNRGVLVPALIDDVRIPIAFRHVQAASLIDWTPQATGHAGFEMLEQSIRNLDRPDPVTNQAGVGGLGAAGQAGVGGLGTAGARQPDAAHPSAATGRAARQGTGAAPDSVQRADKGWLATHPRLALIAAALVLFAAGMIGASMMGGDALYEDADEVGMSLEEAVASREQEALDAGYQPLVEWAAHEVLVAEPLIFPVEAQPGLDYWALGGTTADCALVIHFEDAAREDASDPDDFGFIVEEPMLVHVAVTVESESSAACAVGAGIYVRKAAAAS